MTTGASPALRMGVRRAGGRRPTGSLGRATLTGVIAALASGALQLGVGSDREAARAVSGWTGQQAGSPSTSGGADDALRRP